MDIWYYDTADIIQLALSVQAFVIQDLDSVLHKLSDAAWQKPSPHDAALFAVLSRVRKQLAYPAQYYITSNLLTHYAVLTLDISCHTLFVIGPYLPDIPSLREAQQVLEHLDVGHRPSLPELLRYYQTIPLVSYARITSLGFRIARHLTGASNLFPYIELDFSSLPASSSDTSTLQVPDTLWLLRRKYQLYQQLTASILQARISSSMQLSSQYVQLLLSPIQSRPVAVSEYRRVYQIFHTLLYGIVLQAPGPSIVAVEELFSTYEKVIGHAREPFAFEGMELNMAADYCGLLKKHWMLHGRQYSMPVMKAMDHLAMYPLSDISLDTMASSAHVSPHYLSRLFLKECGCSAVAYLNRQRLEYAKQLLDTTSLSIQSIAQEAGFCSASYFTAQFRKQTGQTPSQYRRQNSQKGPPLSSNLPKPQLMKPIK